MKKVKVLHCLNLLIPGGVERRRMSLFTRLPQDDYEHRVICVEVQDSEYAAEMRKHVAGIDETGSVRSVLASDRYRLAAQIVSEWKPDIIHGAIIEGYTLASVVGRIKRVPIVIMEETSDPQDRRWKGHLLTRVMAGLAHHCIGVSPAVGHYLTDTLRIPTRKVSVINNGVEFPEVPTAKQIADLRAEFGLGESGLVIGSIGRMQDETVKRFGDLIQAFAALGDVSDLRLLLVGDGPERSGLEQLAKELGIADRVVFTGFQFHVGHFYALMDVFALASEREAFGLVVAEAMRCQLPVVATAVGGIPSIVVEGDTGFLVPPRDVEGLATALSRVLSDEELRDRMGQAGKERADRHFSAERYVADVHGLYQRLLEERKR